MLQHGREGMGVSEMREGVGQGDQRERSGWVNETKARTYIHTYIHNNW